MAERSVIAYRHLGVFETRKKTYATLEPSRPNRDETGVMLRSFQQGGPSFAATDYPSMYVSGVVRRLVIDL